MVETLFPECIVRCASVRPRPRSRPIDIDALERLEKEATS